MKFRHFAPISLLVLSCLTGCKPEATLPAANAGTAPAAGMSLAAGVSAAGISAASAGMASTAGVSAGGAAGRSTAGVGSTAGTSGTGSAIPATFETVKLVLGGGGAIMPCAAAPCHGVNGMAPPGKPLELPPMNDQQLYTNLTTYVSKACNNTKLVTPGNPSQSALIKIISGPCGMTPRMPYGCSPDADDCIPDEYIMAVTQWIANGAPR